MHLDKAVKQLLNATEIWAIPLGVALRPACNICFLENVGPAEMVPDCDGGVGTHAK